jgi:hypothetical protein
MPTPNYAKIAAKLVGGSPLSHKLYADGTLVVIDPTGKKSCFTRQQVQQAAELIKPAAIRKGPRSSIAEGAKNKTSGSIPKETSDSQTSSKNI